NPLRVGEHLLEHHPDEELTFFSCEEDESEKSRKCCKCPSKTKKKIIKVRNLNRLSISKRSLFKTTVETWKPGPVKVICPKCKINDRPCIRKQRNKVAYTALGAFFILTCWPLCFIPFLMPKGSTVDLFCKHCGNYLGEYNRATGSLKCACKLRDKKTSYPRNICSELG
ncbi:uncharacterized protein, partial [Leptinotarsa decemlineata]|uniref:uncharacterized protein n=1 Tax=Leptinotarsa decemlineata TaxID=7539 RepID=UPI003D308DCD